MEAILIARVNDPSQIEIGNSLPAQTRKIEQYFKRKNIKLCCGGLSLYWFELFSQ